jgi:hypothetical protein
MLPGESSSFKANGGGADQGMRKGLILSEVRLKLSSKFDTLCTGDFI